MRTMKKLDTTVPATNAVPLSVTNTVNLEIKQSLISEKQTRDLEVPRAIRE
jgi:hypothetical protein